MPASADINLLQNPGFETGEFDPWEYGGNGEWQAIIVTGPDCHTGSYAAYIFREEGGSAWIRQGIDPPRCAEYLEFWYGGTSFPDVKFGILYSDGTEYWEDLSNRDEWTFVHEDLDTTKLVQAVEVWAEAGGWLFLDDFDLEACPAPPVGGEVMMPTPILSPVMLIAVIAAVSAVALGYRFTRR